MTSLPAVLDVRDDLDRIREETNGDVDEDIDAVTTRLETLADEERATRETTSREGVLDEIGDLLLRIEERVDGEAARRAEAARNRLRLYRDARSGGAGDVFVLESKFRNREPEEDVPVDVRGEDGVVEATVVNEGEPGSVRVVVNFLDSVGKELHTVASDGFEMGTNDQRSVEVEAPVPRDAVRYAASAVDAAEYVMPEERRGENGR